MPILEYVSMAKRNIDLQQANYTEQGAGKTKRRLLPRPRPYPALHSLFFYGIQRNGERATTEF